MKVTLLTPRGHPWCAAAGGGGRQHAQTAISPISSSRQPAARSGRLSRPTQVCGHPSCCADHPVCLQQPACSHSGGSRAALLLCGAAARPCCQRLAAGQCTNIAYSVQHAHPPVCLPLQAVSRARLQIVAGEWQTGKSATKRRLGGTGLPPIDGGVSVT